MRRIQTLRIPGRDATANLPYCWDFRRVHVAGSGSAWTLQIPTRNPGASNAGPTHAEQAQWLEALGVAPPDPRGTVVLAPKELEAILARLEPIGVSWAALDAMDELQRLDAAGALEEARRASERLRDLAPAWDDGRMQRLTLLISRLRDPEAAEADLDSLPPGVVSPADRRRQRQSIALLRDDWVSYAAEQEKTVLDGGRKPWDWETLGLARWAAGDLEGSLLAFEEGAADHPGNRDLPLRSVEVIYAQGRVDEAMARVEALAAEGPPHAKTLAWRGWMRRASDPVAAAVDFEAALAVDPVQPVARVGRGLARLDAGDLDGARADLAPFTHCGWSEAADAWRRFQAVAGG